ncbi:hypothetical protein FJN17_07755 [Bradyrhizobium symbiodeficiens]|uniref:Transposase n=1 Tax=Bradyrhizobium symbiodeficiens TaxID=1404367 RepID=A0ABX5W4F7_9BRAD|nr:hypothetical protein [Bradyrhizobium symbiodeficiens]QDF37471.1 hypothetical protein FJN17_07755 [Bradyrhizobium symbiodeficiens]
MEATWRNWCRREGSFAKPPANGEVRVRETTDAERQETVDRTCFMELMKKHPAKLKRRLLLG